jgi:hypothetical protein
MTEKNRLVAEFDLFLDESGNFMETSKDPAEQAINQKDKQRFPSQLAGLLVPRDALSESDARNILQQSHAAAGWPLPPEVHLREYQTDPVYNPSGNFNAYRQQLNLMFDDLLDQLTVSSFQLVRLVNSEQVDYGRKPEYYTNLVAELFVRICRQKQREGCGPISIRIICDQVWLTVPPKRHLTAAEYEAQLQSYITWSAVRRGFPAESNDWELAGVTPVDSKQSRRIQLCDVINYATRGDFNWSGGLTSPRWLHALGAYNWTLQLREIVEQVEQLRDEGSYAMALITLIESVLRQRTSETLKKEIETASDRVIDDLASLLAPVRDSQLGIVLSWLEQIITLKRSVDLGYLIANWLQQNVEAALRKKMSRVGKEAEIDWFSFALNYWALSASNHRGNLHHARGSAQELANLEPRLEGRWEHFPLLLEGCVALSVHETDAWEFASAARRMDAVVAQYDELGELLPSTKVRMRSELKAKALGTRLQVEILRNDGNADLARKLSDAAIDEFSSLDDKDRQYQYRSHLECLTGEFAASRGYLARSLHLNDDAHRSIAQGLVGLGDNSIGQGFALLHWLRIGAVSYLAGEREEFRSFAEAFAGSGLMKGAWCSGLAKGYPVHSILRRVAVIQGAMGNFAAAATALDMLGHRTGAGSGQPTLVLIQMAAMAEVGASFGGETADEYQGLFDCAEMNRPGMRQLAELVEQESAEFPAMSGLGKSCLKLVEEIQTAPAVDASARTALLEWAQQVRY